MPLEIVRGTIKNSIAINELIKILSDNLSEGTLYAGYPIIASAESSYTVEALLVSEEYGLIAFTFPETNIELSILKDEYNKLFFMIEGHLSKHETLRNGRKLALTVNVVSFYPTDTDVPENSDPDYHFTGPESIIKKIKIFDKIEENHYRSLCAAIQRVTTIKPAKKRQNVNKDDSKGAILKIIEKEIANLDQWQKKLL